MKLNPREVIELLEASKGKRKAELIIDRANLVSVTTGELLEDISIIVYGGRIVRLLNRKHEDPTQYIGFDTNIINARDFYVMPGFIESHIHIESSLLNVREFGKIEVMHGTTTLIADPHEIGNVLGYRGIEIFIEESKYALPRIFFEVPSCVPAVDPNTKLDSGGEVIDNNDIKKLLKYDRIIGLGEVMDFDSVINGRDHMIERIVMALNNNKIVEGHAPLLSNDKLDSYILTGISSDHESAIVSEALEKVRKGMYIFIREGSAWKDLKELIKLLTCHHIDSRRLVLVADDINVLDLVEKGHLDHILSEAIGLGVDPIKAIQMVTINPAEHLRIDDKIGIIAPGRYADLVLSKNLDRIKIKKTIINGRVVYNEGKFFYDKNNFTYPEEFKKTIKVKELNEEDLLIKSNGKEVLAYVIKAIPGSSLTEKAIEKLPIKKGYVTTTKDIMHIAVIDRHHRSNNIGKGFIKNLGLKYGAIAQTIAHDTHNLIVAGYNVRDMVIAIRHVINSMGGIAFVNAGNLLSIVRLPIGGLVSDENFESVYQEVKKLEETLREAESSFINASMTLSLTSLPVIPELRVTDRGLVDVMNSKVIDPIIKQYT